MWGANSSGQLGDASTTPRSVPVNVSGLTSGWVAVVAGMYHSCAVTAEYAVRCWGNNMSGQLGDGTSQFSSVPAGVIELTPPTPTITKTPTATPTVVASTNRLGVGMYHGCAIDVSAKLQCWGDNSAGQLGDGTYTAHAFVEAVVGLPTGVASVGTGAWHTCALLVDKQVYCWGDNTYGQLGRSHSAIGATGVCGDLTTTCSPTPLEVVGLPNDIVALAVGSSQNCVVSVDGRMTCWGAFTGATTDACANYAGEWNGSSCSPTPVPLAGTGVVRLAVSGHSCSVATDATVRCWGENSLGQVGAPQSHFYEAPNTVAGLGGPVARVSTGVAFSCAILKTGAVACWGDNQQKQLGNPDAETSEKVPMAVVGLAEPVNDVAAVDHSACALLRDGTVMCWGSNDGGQMGKGGIANSVVPLTVDGFSGIAVELAGRGD